MQKVFAFYKNCPHHFPPESLYPPPPHSSDTEDTPVVSAQDEFDTFTTKKRMQTRIDNVIKTKSETALETMTNNKGVSDVQPKPSSS